MTEVQKAFSDVFRYRRKAAGLSQQKLADMTGLTIASICHYENAKRFPTVDTMITICEAMGTTMEIFWSNYQQYMAEEHGKPIQKE